MFVHAKNDCQRNARKYSIKEDFNQNDSLSVSYNIKQHQSFFAGIKFQYMDIYHTKQTENIPRSCSYLLLKTLFYFISQCTSIPYLESCLCKSDNELDTCNFTFILPRNRPFNESYYEVCKYNTLGYTGLFSLHIERPSYANRYTAISTYFYHLERNMTSF